MFSNSAAYSLESVIIIIIIINILQGVSQCSPWLQTFITRKPKDLP